MPPAGPFVAAAVLCQRVEPRPDGSLDLKGLVDGVVLDADADSDVDGHPLAVLELTALVSIRAGSARGRHELSLHGRYPSGAEGPTSARLIDLTDDAPGASLIVPLELEVHEPGIFHFDVRFDGDLLTRIDLHVRVAPRPDATTH